MRQHINLLTDDLIERKPPLDARWVAGISAFALVVLACGVFWMQYAVRAAQQEAVQAEDRRVEALAEVERLNRQYPPPQQDPQLLLQRDELRRAIAQKQLVVTLLDGGGMGNEAGFSEHLLALARQRVKGLWLTRIELRGGGEQVVLGGKTLESESVPGYLQRLGSETVFLGKEFEFLRIARESEKAQSHNFEVRSLR